MEQKRPIDAMWDDSPVDVTTEVNFIWSIANKLRGTYQSEKYKDVIIPMVIIRRFECALAPTMQKVLAQYEANHSRWCCKRDSRISYTWPLLGIWDLPHTGQGLFALLGLKHTQSAE